MKLICTDIYNGIPYLIRSLEEIRIIMNYLAEQEGKIDVEKEYSKMLELRAKKVTQLHYDFSKRLDYLNYLKDELEVKNDSK